MCDGSRYATFFEYSQQPSLKSTMQRWERQVNRESMLANSRSMPSLQIVVPAAKEAQPAKSCFDLRPTSPPALRRSVSGMRKLLPLRLTTPPLPADQFVYQNLTSEDYGSSFSSSRSSNRRQRTYAPWMQALQYAAITKNRKRDRDTPVYSPAHSPSLARAHFAEDDIGDHFKVLDSPYAELCVVESYDELPASASTPELFTDCASHFGDSGSDSEESVSTVPTSLHTHRESGLSIMCRGEYTPDEESPWLSGHTKCLTPTRSSMPPESKIMFQSWLDDSSSCGSRNASVESFSEVLDACATPLAPLKPQMVRISSSTENTPDSRPHSHPHPYQPPYQDPYPPRDSSLHHPDLVTTLSRRDESMRELIRTHTMNESTIFQAPVPPRCVTPPQRIISNNLSSPFSLLRSPFRSPKAEIPVPRHKLDIGEIADDVLALPLMDQICDGIRGSPRGLQLDTFCITEIRRRNHQARNLSCLPTPTKIPRPCADFFPSSSPPSAKRRTMTSSIMAPLKYAMSTKSAKATKSAKSSAASKTTPSEDSPHVSPSSRYLAAVPGQLPPVDFQTIRAIFPSSDDWWRSVLYAHVTAYNFVQDSQKTYEESVKLRVPKAQRTLGLSREATYLSLSSTMKFSSSSNNMQRSSSESSSGLESFRAIEDGLASSIDRIVSCMAGDYQRVRDHVDGRQGYIDYTLVRALAQVVRTCEFGVGPS